MKIVSHEQGSAEWLNWRRSKITATSASIIMGHNPWSTKLDLWNEMLGITPPKEKNAAMERGNTLEPEARALFIKETGIDMVPIVCESEAYPWMAASLDGWNAEHQAILEIKSPGEKTHLMSINGEIPIYYSDQLHHQCGVTKGQIAYYMSYRPEYKKQPYAIVEARPDWDYIERMIDAERIFYEEYLCTFRRPEEWTFKEKTR